MSGMADEWAACSLQPTHLPPHPSLHQEIVGTLRVTGKCLCSMCHLLILSTGGGQCKTYITYFSLFILHLFIVIDVKCPDVSISMLSSTK
jgi:hypothetical protein